MRKAADLQYIPEGRIGVGLNGRNLGVSAGVKVHAARRNERAAARLLHRRWPPPLRRPGRHGTDRRCGTAASARLSSYRACMGVRREMVVEVTHLTWTDDNLLWQGSYQAQA